jgi:cytidylate kinase
MHTKRKLIIAIDGYASSGKSTLAKDLADALGYLFIDTGAMYRGVAYFASSHGLVSNNAINEQGLIDQLDQINLSFGVPDSRNNRPLLLNGMDINEAIRSSEISSIVSLVAVIPAVRTKLVDLQRIMGQDGGIVMDGRDIGTVVFPNADLKFFVNAALAVRAERRHKDMLKTSPEISLESVQENLASRDQIDTTRATSPLKPAADAIAFDTGVLTRSAQLEKAINHVNEVLAQ